MNVTAIFCDVDDFCKIFIPAWQRLLLPEEVPQRHRKFTIIRNYLPPSCQAGR